MRTTTAVLAFLLAALTAGSARAQTGSGALVYCGSGGCLLPSTQLTGELTAKGASPVDVAMSLPSLTPYRLIFVMDPMGGFASDSPALTQFWKAGGTLALVGECANFAGQANADINTFLAGVGSPLSIVTASDYPDSTCTMYTATVSASSPWTAGVTGLKFAWTSKVNGAASPIASYGSDTLVAGDPKSRLLVSGDSNIFFDSCDFTADGNLRFFDNLWALSAPPASGTGGGASSSTSGGAESGATAGMATSTSSGGVGGTASTSSGGQHGDGGHTPSGSSGCSYREQDAEGDVYGAIGSLLALAVLQRRLRVRPAGPW